MRSITKEIAAARNLYLALHLSDPMLHALVQHVQRTIEPKSGKKPATGSERPAGLYLSPDKPQGSMSTKGNRNIDALAERYLDLCQDQFSALASDPAFADILSRLIRETTAVAEGFAASQGKGGGGERPGPVQGDPPAAGSSSPAAGDASGARQHDLDELARRIDELQRQLDAMEPGGQPDR